MEALILIVGWVSWFATTLSLIWVLFNQDDYLDTGGSFIGKSIAFGSTLMVCIYAFMALRMHTSAVFG